MRWDLLAGALPVYVLLVLVCGAFLLFCLTLKQESRRAEAKARARAAKLELALAELLERSDSLDSRVRQLEREPKIEAPVSLPAAALNTTRRSQAIQRSRRGETPEQIASALAIPLGEVELLLKVHRMVVAAL